MKRRTNLKTLSVADTRKIGRNEAKVEEIRSKPVDISRRCVAGEVVQAHLQRNVPEHSDRMDKRLVE